MMNKTKKMEAKNLRKRRTSSSLKGWTISQKTTSLINKKKMSWARLSATKICIGARSK